MADFDDIIQEININLPDNTTQSITAKKLRDTLTDLTEAIETQQDEFEGGVEQNFETLSESIQHQFNDISDGIQQQQNAFEVVVNTTVESYEQVCANEPQGDYNIKNIDLTNLQVQTLSINFNTNVWTTGNHYTIDCGGAEYMYLETGDNPINIAIVGDTLYFPRQNYSVNAVKNIIVHKNYKGYIQLPEGTTACFINEGELPNIMTLYINENKLVTFKTRRLYINNDIQVDPNSRWNFQFTKVKAGKTYQLRFKTGLPNTTTFTAQTWWTEGYPVLSLPVTDVFASSANQKEEYVRTYVADADGYILIGVYRTDALENNPDNTEIKNFFGTNEVTSLKFLQQNWRAYTILRNRISGIAAPHYVNVSATQYHIEIPITVANKYVRITTNTYISYIAFLTEELPTDGTTPVPYVDDTVLTGIPVNSDFVLKIPEGTKILYVYCGNSTAYLNLPAFIALSFDDFYFPNVVQKNGYLDTKRFLDQTTGLTRYEGDLEDFKPLCLLHYSDLHGYTVNQNRITDFRETFAEYIDDTIQTGDLLADKYTDDVPFGDISTPEAIAENPNRNILSVIGNHDTQGTSSQGWHYYQGLPIYNKLIAPFKEYWNITQPENADTEGYCFYYKDYTRSRIRLVVIDPWNTDENYNSIQQTWFQSTLEGARTSGLSVIVASHYRPVTDVALDTSFTKIGAALDPDDIETDAVYVGYVNDFQNNGGDFVCWLAGHSHYDFISMITSPNKQVSICIANACMYYMKTRVTNITNSLHISVPNDSKSWDLFNLITVDTVYHLITLYRVGSNWDKYGRYVKSCCINYQTGEVIWK